jgi:hypothetical protein
MGWLFEVIGEILFHGLWEFLTSRDGRPILYVLLVVAVIAIGCWAYFR